MTRGELVGPSKVLFDGDGGSYTRQELDDTLAARAAVMTRAGVEGDVVAISLPSTAELALTVLAAMTVGTAAPLNPGATVHETRMHLELLEPRLLLADGSSPAALAARELDIELLEPGCRDSRGPAPVAARTDPDSVALLLPTSGTTGRPKLVPLTHGNLDASAANVAAGLALSPDDRCLGVMPYFHIHGLVAGLLAPLVSGGAVVATGTFDPSRVRSWIEEYDPTWYTGVPTMHRALLDLVRRDGALDHHLRFIRSSSSPLAPSLLEELEGTLGAPVIEAYGMTEASHQLATNPLPPAVRKPGTVGRASGTEISLLSDGHLHTEAARTGEVVIRGPGVTTGYRDDLEANAAAFHHGWFRTGDLGRLDADGYLELVGRLKEMINRGGEKVAPQEVDEVLLDHPAVAQALTFPLAHPTLGEDVGAVVVLRPGAGATPAELIEHAATRLAGYKVPRSLIVTDRLPLGPTGKPQRIGLAERLGLTTGGDRPPAASTPLGRLWGSILGMDGVPGDVDFFALGGDSLMALALVSSVETDLGRTVPLDFFSEGPATLDRMEAVAGPAETTEGTSAGESAGTEDDSAISFAEQGVLVRSMLDPDGALFNVPLAFRLRGPLDLARLGRALQQVVEGHEGLRTTFPTSGGRVRRSVTGSLPVRLDVRELRPGDELATLLGSEARQRFDLDHGPLVRAGVMVLGPEDHVLWLTLHHAVVDGLARELLVEALAATYRDPDAAVPATGSPAALAAAQRAALAAGRLESQRDFWLEQLTDLPDALELPGQRPAQIGRGRPDGGRGDGEDRRPGDLVPFELDADTSDSLRGLARSCRTTPMAVFLAGLAGVLSRLSGASEIVIGTPAANRHRGRTAGVIGMLANMVPLRLDLSGDPTFEDLVGRVRRTALAALAHQEYPYERMLEEVRDRGAGQPDGLFRVVAQLRAPAGPPDFGPGLEVGEVAVHSGAAKFDLNFDLRDRERGIGGSVEFCTGTMERARVEDLCRRVGRVLAGAVARPSRTLSQLPLLDEGEQRRVVTLARGPAPLPPSPTVVDLIAEQTRRVPGCPAVIDRRGTLSYRELDRRSEEFANALAAMGIGRGDTVGIVDGRNAETVVALLGVLRSGAAYLPFDPSYPELRLRAMAGAPSLRLVVHQGGATTWLAPQVAAVDFRAFVEGTGAPDAPLDGPVPDDAAYILYTSGSTGTPKGVVIPHSAIVNLMSWSARTFRASELARVLVGASLNFDFSVIQIYATLTAGGCAVMAENVLAIRDLGTEVTLLSAVPAALGALLDDAAIPESVCTILAGGDVLTGDLAARLQELPQRPRLLNLYGPTETTVLCSAAELTHPSDVGRVGDPWHGAAVAVGEPSIGKPIDGVVTLVVDRFGRPLPSGVPGELWIGGRGLAHGYLDDASLTAGRFIDTDIPELRPCRMYRTGDLVWADDQGDLHYRGRLDDQLEIRGMRVEPGDVEAVLVAHPDVTAAAAYAVGDGRSRQLHAAVVGPGQIDLEVLREFALQRLPRHMVPRQFHIRDRLPLSASNKVDRKILAAGSAPAPGAGAPTPGGELEELLLSVWRRLLENSDLGLDDSFFEAGGDSLQVLAMLTQVEGVTGVRLPLAWCFSGPVTVRSLAVEVEEASAGPAAIAEDPTVSPLVIPVRAAGSRPPIFLLYPNARTSLTARYLLDVLDPERPVYALTPTWRDGVSRAELARRTVGAITRLAHGPFHLAGHSLGGVVAYETTALLEASGRGVGALVLIDTRTPEVMWRTRVRRELGRQRRVVAGRTASWLTRSTLPPDHAGSSVGGGVSRRSFVRRSNTFMGKDNPVPLRRPFDLLTTDDGTSRHGELLGWDSVHRGPVASRRLAGDHASILQPPISDALGRLIETCLCEVERSG